MKRNGAIGLDPRVADWLRERSSRAEITVLVEDEVPRWLACRVPADSHVIGRLR